MSLLTEAPPAAAIAAITALLLAACGRSGFSGDDPAAETASSSSASSASSTGAGAPPPHCTAVPEDFSPCSLPDVPDDAGVPSGTITACPRKEALLPENDAAGATIMKARFAFVFVSHNGHAIYFSAPSGNPPDLGAAMYEFFKGTYTVTPQPFSGKAPPAFSAVALPASALTSNNPFDTALQGTGRLVITNDWQDFIITRGSIDVVFPDGCRLLADFVAPVGAIE